MEQRKPRLLRAKSWWIVLLFLFLMGCQPVGEADGQEVVAENSPKQVSAVVTPEGTANEAPLATPVSSAEEPSDVKRKASDVEPTGTISPTSEVEGAATTDNDAIVAPAASGGSVAEYELSAPADSLSEAGYEVYRQQYCGVCHQLAAAETRGTFGPVHDGVASTAQARIADPAYSGQATSVEGYIYESIVNPKAYIVPGYAASSHQMPSYAHLSEEALEKLVAFLAVQK